MTVHKAKGLEFPVVDPRRPDVQAVARRGRALARSRAELCALKIGGWAPIDLLLHDAEEAARDRAEAERLTYVAATRARDLLVVPAIGDGPYDGGWLDPLTAGDLSAGGAPAAIPRARPACPAFKSKDSVLSRPDGDPASPETVAPGDIRFGAQPGAAASHASREPRAAHRDSDDLLRHLVGSARPRISAPLRRSACAATI